MAARIVVIDDQSEHRLLAGALIANVPETDVVGEARDGWAGAQLVDELQPDLVVLDMSMPVMDGMEALPLIRALCPTARIVVWSAEADPETSLEAMRLGANRFVAKTSEPSELITAVAELTAAVRRQHRLAPA